MCSGIVLSIASNKKCNVYVKKARCIEIITNFIRIQ